MTRLKVASRVLTASLWVLTAAACGDDEPSPTDTGTSNPDAGVTDMGATDMGTMPSACATAITDLEGQVAAELPNFSAADPAEMVQTTGDQSLEADYAGKYRDDLPNHPGCQPRMGYDNNSEAFISDNEAMVPAGSSYAASDYPCAAKEYDQANEDTSKPIVILVHGNSSGVLSFEEYAVAARAGTTLSNVAMFQFMVDTMTRTQLASTLLADGYKVISFDARTDLVSTLGDYSNDTMTGNPFNNIDHGWAVPMLQALIKSVINNNPGRELAIVGHSLGVTVIRDSLRRLFNEAQAGATGSVNPFASLSDVILLSGANHGVNSGEILCNAFQGQMRGSVGCEMGDRASFTPTYFTRANNGPSDLWSAPCADGDYAFGLRGVCGDNTVEYTTVTMEDLPDGSLQDEFISEASSRLELPDCVDNQLISLQDYDTSGFFLTILPGFFANHFGSARSPAGIQLIMDRLAD